jgi:NhaP-type Na+/H+ or K+/H+ antiporter
MAFDLALIIILGLGADYLFRHLRLPGLVGMLVAGALAGPYVWDLMSPEMMQVSGDFRKIALIVILLRAGFKLRRDPLHRVGRAALIMSSVPAVFDIIGVLLAAPFLLGLAWMEETILGCILAAISPAVVVPLMIDFMDRAWGPKRGSPPSSRGPPPWTMSLSSSCSASFWGCTAAARPTWRPN